jgi:exodeoxyribonuclease VII large subunit
MSPASTLPLIDFSRDVYTVSRLNAEVRAVLDGSFPLLWVQGELSNLSQPSSGHLYFSLKDEASQVRCAMFRSKRRLLACRPINGQQMLARARISLYEPRGEYQLIVEHMEPAGDGALRVALEQLKQQLAAEGLFADARKRVPPRYPRQVGLITSTSGAALHDLLTVLGRRFPLLPVLIYPAAVQGEGAVAELTAALQQANRRRDCDVLILSRGGGSLEDLMPFNDARLARVIAASECPVVSGIGHEVDLTIAELVADVRGATPSAAAAAVAPDAADARSWLRALRSRLAMAQRQMLTKHAQRLIAIQRHLRLLHPRAQLEQQLLRNDELQQRLERAAAWRVSVAAMRVRHLRRRIESASPAARMPARRDAVSRVLKRLERAGERLVGDRRRRLEILRGGLDARSPVATLARGYAIVSDAASGVVVRSPKSVVAGMRLDVRVHDGRFAAVVADSSDKRED